MENRDPIAWFLRLRLFAFLAQIAILVTAIYYYKINLPIVAITTILILIPITHIACISINLPSWVCRESTKPLLIFDTLLLTALLFLSGGPSNPFSLVYLVHVVLAAVLLNSLWTWIITWLSIICFAFLYLKTPPLVMHHAGIMTMHLHGMLVSYIVVAILVTYFLNKILSELNFSKSKQRDLLENQRRLAAITTLSTHAAHELNTPLSSIALIAHELDQLVSKAGRFKASQIRSDVALLKNEVKRCSSIIEQFCLNTANIGGEAPQYTAVNELLLEVQQSLNLSIIKVCILGIPNGEFLIQKRPAIWALNALVRNALEASYANSSNPKVEIDVRYIDDQLKFNIIDYAGGISKIDLEKIREPFYTTKTTGVNLGLGVYIAQMVAMQLKGSLEYKSTLGVGTVATISFSTQHINSKLAGGCK